MTNYQEHIQNLVPVEALGLPTDEQHVGRTTIPETSVELRRWGPTFTPLDYQAEVIEGIDALLERGNVQGLLSLPTGAGKTLTASWILLRVLEKAGSNGSFAVGLWIAPQRELLYQTADALQGAWWSGIGPDSVDIRIVEASERFSEPERTTCLLMTPIMARNTMRGGMSNIGALIFDEAHHISDNEFGRIWRLLDSKGSSRLTLGLSATPTRREPKEERALRKAFAKTLFLPASLGTTAIQGLIEKGILARPRFRLIEGVPEFARTTRSGDRRSLQSLITNEERWAAIVACLRSKEMGQTVVYALDRQHGEMLTKHLRHLKVRAEYIDGTTPFEHRIGVLERFRNGSTRVLVNVALLLEGVDCPAAESVVLTYPVQSDLMLQQMIGRVLRGPKVGGTEECGVWAVDGSQEELDRLLFGNQLAYAGWKIKMLALKS